MFRGEDINFLARLTLGQPTVCSRAIWTLTRAKSFCLCAFFVRLWQFGELAFKPGSHAHFHHFEGLRCFYQQTVGRLVHAINSNANPASRQVEGMCHFTSKPVEHFNDLVFWGGQNVKNYQCLDQKSARFERQFAKWYPLYIYMGGGSYLTSPCRLAWPYPLEEEKRSTNRVRHEETPKYAILPNYPSRDSSSTRPKSQ